MQIFERAIPHARLGADSVVGHIDVTVGDAHVHRGVRVDAVIVGEAPIAADKGVVQQIINVMVKEAPQSSEGFNK